MSESASLPGSSRIVVSALVIIGFTVLLGGGIAYYFGNALLGEAMVLAGVFLFTITFLCWMAAKRHRSK
jgi:hypothetical protein